MLVTSGNCNEIKSDLIVGSDVKLHIKVQFPILLCAVKTVEGDFRFC